MRMFPNDTWMKCNFDFGLPIVILECSVRELAALKIRDAIKRTDIGNASISDDSIQEGRNDYRKSLDNMEQEILKIVKYYRPELEGGAVAAIECRQMTWEIYYWHPSLDRTITVSNSVPRMPLIPPTHPEDLTMPPISLERTKGVAIMEIIDEPDQAD